MKRREFIRKSVGAGIVGSALSFAGYNKLFGAEMPDSGTPYDLVAVRGGEPEIMFDRAIEALGGMGNFVKSGQTVVLKPNMSWDVPPERAANTNPGLVKHIVKKCYEAGASQVYAFDNTCDNWIRSYRNSGVEEAVKEGGGRVLPGNTEDYYKDVKVEQGRRLTEAKVHELVLNSDVYINIPVLKHHSSSRITICLKNLMGIVWDRRFWHTNDLHQCIADFGTWERKPDLNIVDAYRVMMRNGPRGVSVDDVSEMKSLIASTDMVAADAAATRLFGLEPEEVGHIRIAHEMGVGNMKLDQLNISRITV